MFLTFVFRLSSPTGNQPYLQSKGLTVRKTRINRRELDRLDRLSRLLDTAFVIPGTNIRMGIDPLLGLIPGIGDLAGLFLSSYIILQAAKLGAPRRSLMMMVFNILLETVIGAIPVVGDMFDIYFKANRRNVALLRRYA
jgi:hypothetical protein